MTGDTTPVTSEDIMLALGNRSLTCIDLSRPYVPDMPKSASHPPYTHALQRRHGDRVRVDGGSAANDVIVLGTHVGTHMDALAHISHNGMLHGGVDAAEAQKGGRFETHGIDAFPPYVGRGVLLDVPKALGVSACAPAQRIGSRELQAAAEVQGVEIMPDTVILVRTGWGQYWDDQERYLGVASGVPGVDEDGAQWLVRHRARAVGADTVAFECIPPGLGHARLPAHRILLVEAGINIIETLDLETLSARGLSEFLLFLAPLNLKGATGAPVRPIAVVSWP